MGRATIVRKYTYRHKGLFGTRDKYRFILRLPNGRLADFKAWHDEYHALNVGDTVEHSSIPDAGNIPHGPERP